MGPVSVVRRSGRTALALLLAALVAVVGLSVPGAALSMAGSGLPDAGAAVGGAPMDALAPSRAEGRPVAEPSVLRLHGPCAGGLLGAATAPGALGIDLVLVGQRSAVGSAAPGSVVRGMAGVRGPPRTRMVQSTVS